MGSPVTRLFDRIDADCAGRNGWVRLPALAFFVWVWLRHAADPAYRSVFGGLNLGVHELGHVVFGPFGDVTGALGGSLLQCLVPLIGAAMFVRQRDWFAVAFAAGWLATNLFEVSVYAADAVAMRLPLVTPGGGHPIHDWNYVLGAKGWLRHTEAVAALIRTAGHAAMLTCVLGTVWVVSRMIRVAPRKAGGGGFPARPREEASLRPGWRPDPPGIATSRVPGCCDPERAMLPGPGAPRAASPMDSPSEAAGSRARPVPPPGPGPAGKLGRGDPGAHEPRQDPSCYPSSCGAENVFPPGGGLDGTLRGTRRSS